MSDYHLAELFSYYNVVLLLKGLAATFLLSVIGCFAGFVAGFVIARWPWRRCARSPSPTASCSGGFRSWSP